MVDKRFSFMHSVLCGFLATIMIVVTVLLFVEYRAIDEDHRHVWLVPGSASARDRRGAARRPDDVHRRRCGACVAAGAHARCDAQRSRPGDGSNEESGCNVGGKAELPRL